MEVGFSLFLLATGILHYGMTYIGWVGDSTTFRQWLLATGHCPFPHYGDKHRMGIPLQLSTSALWLLATGLSSVPHYGMTYIGWVGLGIPPKLSTSTLYWLQATVTSPPPWDDGWVWGFLQSCQLPPYALQATVTSPPLMTTEGRIGGVGDSTTVVNSCWLQATATSPPLWDGQHRMGGVGDSTTIINFRPMLATGHCHQSPTMG